jgi:hypothetical protein
MNPPTHTPQPTNDKNKKAAATTTTTTTATKLLNHDETSHSNVPHRMLLWNVGSIISAFHANAPINMT